MNKIDEKAFKIAWNEQTPPIMYEFRAREFLEAYEAAKVAEQPVSSARAIVPSEAERVAFDAWYTDNVLKFFPHLKIGRSYYQCGLSAWVASARVNKRESVEQVMGEGSRLRMENSPACLSDTPAKIIREALEAAPVYVTKDGTWLNLRPDAHKQKGGAMIKVEGLEAEAIKSFGEKVEAALAALNQIED